MKKLNILHFIPHLGLGGAEQIVLSLCQNMNREKFHPLVAYWGSNDTLAKKFRDQKIEVISLSFSTVCSLSSIRKVSSLLKNRHIDLLHTHFMDADFIGFFAALLRGIPQICHIHSFPFPQERRHCWRYKALSFFMKKLICVSEIEKTHLIKKAGINSKKIQVIYNGIDCHHFGIYVDGQEREEFKKNLGVSADEKIWGVVSRLVPEKGNKNLIKSFKNLLDVYPQCHLLIVGDGPEKEELLGLCQSLQIASKVTLIGSREDIPQLLDVMDFFVFPGETEAMGMAVLEAMAAGKPILATNDGGIPELIENNKEGILIKPNDIDALTQAMGDLMEHADIAHRLGEKAQIKAKIFSCQRMFRETEKLYQEIFNS